MAPRLTIRRPSAVTVVLAATALQLLVAARGPLDGDETLYWEWSRHLAWGYFDHPPGIAWLIRLGTILLGVHPLGIRMTAVLAGLGGSLVALALARRHGGETAALRTALIMVCLPVVSNWLVLATPDAALYLTGTGALLLVDNALRSPARSRAAFRWWIAAGFVLGLAGLSKELAILIPAGIALALLTHRELRPRLAGPGPWIAALVAILVTLPLVAWNRDHGWVLLEFMLHRGLGVQSGGTMLRELSFLGGQAIAASPILLVLLGTSVVATLRGDRDPRRHLLATVAFTIFGAFAVVALRHEVEPNWVLLAYPPAAILLATRPVGVAARRWLGAGLWLGLALVLLLDVRATVPLPSFARFSEPVRRGRGWEDVAARVDATTAMAAGSGATWIAGNRFQDASQLAFNLRAHPFVFSLNIDSRANQYDFWPSFTDLARPGDRLILVVDDSTEDRIARAVGGCFERVTPGGRITTAGTPPALAAKRIWILDGWSGRWLAGRDEAADLSAGCTAAPIGGTLVK